MASKLRQSESESTTSTLAVNGSLLTTVTAAPAEVRAAAELITVMKGSIGSLGRTLDSLGEQTVRMIQEGGEAHISGQIASIYKDLENQEKKQADDIKEIQTLLREVLEHDVIEHLTALIEAGILKDIDEIVAQQVAQHLPQYMPKALQDELQHHRKQLDSLQKDLHNSESQRANASLRSHRLDERVHTLFDAKGEISKAFPQTLSEMFSLTPEHASALVREYGLGQPAASRETNVNRFMQHCGVEYQLVSTGEGAWVPCRLHVGAGVRREL